MPWWFQGTIVEAWQVIPQWVVPPKVPLIFLFDRGNRYLIRRDDVPDKAVFTSRHKQLPDTLLIETRPLISQRLYRHIQSLEPGRHEFLPIEIRHASGRDVLGPDGETHRPAEQPYYLLNVTDRIDALDLSRCDMTDALTVPGTSFFSTVRANRVVFRSELIAGRHLWEGINHMPGKPFISDTLGAWIIANKMKGIELNPTKWLGEGPPPKIYR